jgi:hypothetical protein
VQVLLSALVLVTGMQAVVWLRLVCRSQTSLTQTQITPRRKEDADSNEHH